MPMLRNTMLIAAAALLAGTAAAEDTAVAVPAPEDVYSATQSIDALLPATSLLSEWRLSRPVDLSSYSDDWSTSLWEVRFQDNSALGRLRRLRSLSLLTLAQDDDSRLFLGVNEKGLLGLHFNAFSGARDNRYLEVVRMPYLKDDLSGPDEPAAD